jgi:hypothetical protein
VSQEESIWTEEKLAKPLTITMSVNDWCTITGYLWTLFIDRNRTDAGTETRNQECPIDRQALLADIERIEQHFLVVHDD